MKLKKIKNICEVVDKGGKKISNIKKNFVETTKMI